MPDLKLIQLTDLSAPTGEVCGPSCCEPGATSSSDLAAAATAAYAVSGMTCEHCVKAVTEEVSAIPGVQAVDIRLVPGGTSTVTVGSERPIDGETIRGAIEEAGYELV